MKNTSLVKSNLDPIVRNASSGGDEKYALTDKKNIMHVWILSPLAAATELKQALLNSKVTILLQQQVLDLVIYT